VKASEARFHTPTPHFFEKLLSTDGLVEVAQFIEFLQFRGQNSLKALASGKHAAFGIWADRPEAKDPAAFALKLRQDMEKRQ